MNVIVLIGRILFILVFVDSALVHLVSPERFKQYVEGKQVPTPRRLLVGSAIFLLIGSAMVLFGVWGDLGSLALSTHLVATTPILHAFWRHTDPFTRTVERARFFKHMSLVGGGLALFALFAYDNGPGLTLTGSLFHL